MAVAGPGPAEVFAGHPGPGCSSRPRPSCLGGPRHGNLFHQVLNACRAWRYLEDDTLSSKVEAGRWARLRPWPPAPEGGPAEGRRPWSTPPGRPTGPCLVPTTTADLAAASRFVAAVLEQFGEAGP